VVAHQQKALIGPQALQAVGATQIGQGKKPVRPKAEQRLDEVKKEESGNSKISNEN